MEVSPQTFPQINIHFSTTSKFINGSLSISFLVRNQVLMTGFNYWSYFQPPAQIYCIWLEFLSPLFLFVSFCHHWTVSHVNITGFLHQRFNSVFDWHFLVNWFVCTKNTREHWYIIKTNKKADLFSVWTICLIIKVLVIDKYYEDIDRFLPHSVFLTTLHPF